LCATTHTHFKPSQLIRPFPPEIKAQITTTSLVAFTRDVEETALNIEKYSQEEIFELVRKCLSRLYHDDGVLFRRNSGEALGERCLVFRFAYHLQNEIDDYYVDCDYNSSFQLELGPDGRQKVTEIPEKDIDDPNGTSRRRYVDIIVHRREYSFDTDFFCFEVKKWNNHDREGEKKDLNNLDRMTSDYRYQYGFHVILGKTKNQTIWTVFSRRLNGNGALIDKQLVFSRSV